MTGLTSLAAAARFELQSREAKFPQQVDEGKRTAESARRQLAAWRAIVALLEGSDATFDPCLGDTPAIAWAEIVAAAHKAVEHRFAAGLRDSASANPAHLTALREIRSRLVRSAIQQGAQAPSFDPEPQAESKAA